MALVILTEGFEGTVRNRLGVSVSELPDPVINDRMIAERSESVVIKRVPEYALITDEYEKMMLEIAVQCYVCYLLSPSMPRRLNIEVQTIDVKWKKGKVDWEELAQMFLAELEGALAEITSVPVLGIPNYNIGGLGNWANVGDRDRERGLTS